MSGWMSLFFYRTTNQRKILKVFFVLLYIFALLIFFGFFVGEDEGEGETGGARAPSSQKETASTQADKLVSLVIKNVVRSSVKGMEADRYQNYLRRVTDRAKEPDMKPYAKRFLASAKRLAVADPSPDLYKDVMREVEGNPYVDYLLDEAKKSK